MEFIIILILVLYVAYQIFKPKNCDICDLQFKRVYYTWTIQGEKKHLCPNCNSKMGRKVSSAKFNKNLIDISYPAMLFTQS